jgi:NAD(P)-dependent dehydrogenase (short-subunit alcohol dehydrogenase family)
MQYVMITGAFGGLGQATAKLLAQNNYTVFACDKVTDETTFKNLSVIPVTLDVTEDNSIFLAVQKVKEYTDTLAAVINGAGTINMQSMVEGEEEIFKKVFDVNFWGAYKINRAFFGFLKPGYSKIINITSEVARYSAHPFDGYYGISKTALDSYNDCLRRELQLLDLSVIKVQSGSFKTNLLKDTNLTFGKLLNDSALYGKKLLRMAKLLYDETSKANDPTRFARLILKIVTAKRPKICYRIANSFKLRLLSKLPETLQDKIYKMFIR